MFGGRLIQSMTAQNREPAKHRRQRRAQLMRQHREEFVFCAAGNFRILTRLMLARQ